MNLLLLTILFSQSTEPQWVNYIVLEQKLFNGEVEARLWDGSRVDILNTEHAIEVDWAKKWAEGIGQAIFYSRMTGRKAGLLLLIEDGDERYMVRAMIAAGDIVRVWFYDIERRALVR